MVGMAFGGLILAVLAVAFAGFMALALVIKLAVRLILLPLLLIKWLIGGVVLLVVGPIVVLASLIALTVLALAFAVPFLPLLLVVGLVWLIVRSTRRPVIA